MGKKKDAAGVKAEVEKQTAAIRRLATALRDEANNGTWLSKLKGRDSVLTGHAQTLDGIADSLTFAVNHDQDVRSTNRFVRASPRSWSLAAVPLGPW